MRIYNLTNKTDLAVAEALYVTVDDVHRPGEADLYVNEMWRGNSANSLKSTNMYVNESINRAVAHDVDIIVYPKDCFTSYIFAITKKCKNIDLTIKTA